MTYLKPIHWLLLTLALAGCPQRIHRKVGAQLQTVDMKAPYIKCHMKDGGLYVLHHWTIHETTQELVGTGEYFATDRAVTGRQEFRVPFRDVALYETNTVGNSPWIAAMAVVTGVSTALTVACIAQPKACFGSCPTFYATDDKTGQKVLQAEGFSDAISPVLETHDIDALWRTTGHGGELTIQMTNEAYETHVVKQVDLLAIPRPHGARILAAADGWWVASKVAAATTCRGSPQGESLRGAPQADFLRGAPGDCTRAVAALDGVERSSLTDAHDLGAREAIDLEFEPVNVGERAAVVIGARQTLVTTFLLYQGLAYLGKTAGAWLASLERGNAPAQISGTQLSHVLGGIEVQVEREGEWQTVGEVYETGPLATDVHVVLLPEGATGQRVRLRIARGGWRIDMLALATLTDRATPIRIAPLTIRGELGPDYAAGRAVATQFPIVALPGDAYQLSYRLPPGQDYELFLDSRGYYLEWIREQWLREQQPLSAVHMLLDPKRALKELAPVYKRFEPEAEAAFWGSRYARP